MISANASSTERTSKRTTKVPVSEVGLRRLGHVYLTGGILRDYSTEGYNYDGHSEPIATARRQQPCSCSIDLNICRHRFRT